jgi:Uma2 family endonuclease
MSAVDRPKRTTIPPLVHGQHLDQPTFHERYEAMPPDTRAELVGGVVYVPSPMLFDHGETSRIIIGWLDRYQRFTPRIRGADGATVKLDLKGEPQPDAFLFIPADLGGQSSVDAENYLTGAPELVVEIARSSRHYDLTQKKADYERAGVLEYLVVKLDPDRIHWFIRRGRRFAGLHPGSDGIYRSQAFPGLWLDPGAIFTQDRARRDAILEQGVATPVHAAFVARLAAAGVGKAPR